MALYTQKFIAADYLARVQTQTHFFLRTTRKTGRLEGGGGGKGKYERRESSSEREFGIRRNKIRTRLVSRMGEDTVSERAESSDDGHGSSSFLLVPYPCARLRPRIRGPPPEPRRSEGISPAKTCIAFYCRIDCLNNSQRGNPSPTMRSAVCAFSSCLLFLLFLRFSLHYNARVFNYAICFFCCPVCTIYILYTFARENRLQLIGLK